MASCDLCGEASAVYVLNSPRLDGPLVRCSRCGLHRVEGARQHIVREPSPETYDALHARVTELDLVHWDVDQAESRLRRVNDAWRLAVLGRVATEGRLLDVGAGRGDFVAAASRHFDASGVEPDAGTQSQAEAQGWPVAQVTLEAAGLADGSYDVLTLLHVIEHVASPRQLLQEACRVLRPGGCLLVETPVISSLQYRLRRASWRQLIPDHYWFFDNTTLKAMLWSTGFVPVIETRARRRASLRFVVDRLRRSDVRVPGWLAAPFDRGPLAELGVTLRLDDVVLVVATKRESSPASASEYGDSQRAD